MNNEIIILFNIIAEFSALLIVKAHCSPRVYILKKIIKFMIKLLNTTGLKGKFAKPPLNIIRNIAYNTSSIIYYILQVKSNFCFDFLCLNK